MVFSKDKCFKLEGQSKNDFESPFVLCKPPSLKITHLAPNTYSSSLSLTLICMLILRCRVGARQRIRAKCQGRTRLRSPSEARAFYTAPAEGGTHLAGWWTGPNGKMEEKKFGDRVRPWGRGPPTNAPGQSPRAFFGPREWTRKSSSRCSPVGERGMQGAESCRTGKPSLRCFREITSGVIAMEGCACCSWCYLILERDKIHFAYNIISRDAL